jgi:hypothetical protein
MTITATTGTANGNITSIGNELCTERGAVYSTASHGAPGNVAPGSSGYEGLSNVTAGGYNTGAFTVELTGLTPGAQYFVRAYTRNRLGYAYGDEVSFFTILLGSDSTAVDMVEAGAKQIFGEVAIASTDTLPVVLDDVGVFASPISVPGDDPLALALGELATVLVFITAPDTVAPSLGDVAALAVVAAALDALEVALDDLRSDVVLGYGPPDYGMPVVLANETGIIAVLVSASDVVAPALDDVGAAPVVGGDIVVLASDATQPGLADTGTIAAALLSPDTTAVVLLDAATVYAILTSPDAIATVVTDDGSIVVALAGEDVAAVVALDLAAVLLALAGTDAVEIAGDETNAIAVLAEAQPIAASDATAVTLDEPAPAVQASAMAEDAIAVGSNDDRSDVVVTYGPDYGMPIGLVESGSVVATDVGTTDPGPASIPSYSSGFARPWVWRPGFQPEGLRKVYASDGAKLSLVDDAEAGPLLLGLLREIAKRVAAERAVVPPPTGLERVEAGDQAGLAFGDVAAEILRATPTDDAAALPIQETPSVLAFVRAGDALAPTLVEKRPDPHVWVRYEGWVPGEDARAIDPAALGPRVSDRWAAKVAAQEAALSAATSRLDALERALAEARQEVAGVRAAAAWAQGVHRQAVVAVLEDNAAAYDREVGALRGKVAELERLLDDAEAMALA